MGSPIYKVPAEYAAEWPQIVSKTGCNVDIHCTYRSIGITKQDLIPRLWQLAGITYGSAFVDMEIDTRDGAAWDCSILVGGGNMGRDLAMCVIAQITAAGGYCRYGND